MDKLKRKLGKPEYSDISNIDTKVADAYDLPFQDESIDIAILVDVLPGIPDTLPFPDCFLQFHTRSFSRSLVMLQSS